MQRYSTIIVVAMEFISERYSIEYMPCSKITTSTDENLNNAKKRVRKIRHISIKEISTFCCFAACLWLTHVVKVKFLQNHYLIQISLVDCTKWDRTFKKRLITLCWKPINIHRNRGETNQNEKNHTKRAQL